jgi:hypothetical protein
MRFAPVAAALLTAAAVRAEDVVEEVKDAAAEASSSVSSVAESATSSVVKPTFTV